MTKQEENATGITDHTLLELWNKILDNAIKDGSLTKEEADHFRDLNGNQRRDSQGCKAP